MLRRRKKKNNTETTSKIYSYLNRIRQHGNANWNEIIANKNKTNPEYCSIFRNVLFSTRNPLKKSVTVFIIHKIYLIYLSFILLVLPQMCFLKTLKSSKAAKQYFIARNTREREIKWLNKTQQQTLHASKHIILLVLKSKVL